MKLLSKVLLFSLLIPSLAYGAAGDAASVGGKAVTAISTINGKAGADLVSIMGKNYTDGDVAGCAKSDDFNRADGDSLGSCWTEDGGDADISSNTLLMVSGSYATAAAIHTESTSGVSQYAKVTMTACSASAYPGIILRYTNSTSSYYMIGPTCSGTQRNWYWYSYTSLGTGEATIQNQTGTTSIDTIGVTLSGTGDSTVVRIWENPTANVPDSASSWDSGAADIEFTNNPVTVVDTGNKVGLVGAQSDANTLTFDNFYFGDIP